MSDEPRLHKLRALVSDADSAVIHEAMHLYHALNNPAGAHTAELDGTALVAICCEWRDRARARIEASMAKGGPA